MLARLLTGLTLSALIACSGSPRAPVEDRQGRVHSSVYSSSRSYRVQPGDTLYSIAFRYGLDFRKVAAANHIASPYTIFPGQKIALREASAPVPAPTKPVARKSAQPASKPARAPSADVKVAKKPSVETTPSAAVGHWRWPTSGNVLRRYSSTVHKGIDIGGRRGDVVAAVADGRVVYAGTGIVGLGKLLIVKHNDIYLSAYGHNDRLLVAEGSLVRAGQTIARKGSSGTDTVKLHFEIRKAGKPVNPLNLLPRR